MKHALMRRRPDHDDGYMPITTSHDTLSSEAPLKELFQVTLASEPFWLFRARGLLNYLANQHVTLHSLKSECIIMSFGAFGILLLKIFSVFCKNDRTIRAF